MCGFNVEIICDMLISCDVLIGNVDAKDSIIVMLLSYKDFFEEPC